MTTPVPSPRPLRFGVLGAGMIATIWYGYLPNLHKVRDRVTLAGIADIDLARAQAVAGRFEIDRAVASLDELLELDLDAVVNLLPGPAHFATSMRILESGRHLVTEKPIAGTLEEADRLLDLAERRGLLVVTAPADMLASEWIRARELVASNAIGKVAFARVQSSHPGPAAMSWPMDPSPFYAQGVGALLDLAVYGLTEVTGVLGPARRVAAMSGVTVPTRRARGGPYDGLEFPVTAPDNNLVLLDFGDATFAVVDGTYNVVATRAARMEVYGLEGTIVVKRPDEPAPPVEVYRLEAAPGVGGWVSPWTYTLFPVGSDRFAELQRGALLEHLADCVAEGRRPVASGLHARHVLEVMLAAERSAAEGRFIDVTSTF